MRTQQYDRYQDSLYARLTLDQHDEFGYVFVRLDDDLVFRSLLTCTR